MRQTVVLCDLHDGSAVASTSVHVLIEAARHRLDVCADHAAWLRQLPTATNEDREHEHDAAATASRPPTRVRTTSGTSYQRTSAGTENPTAHARSQAGSRRSLRAERAAARDWARTQGSDVADRGRLPSGLLERYREHAG